MKFCLSFCCLLLLYISGFAQNADSLSFITKKQKFVHTQKFGMAVLGGWAACNIIGGTAYGLGQKDFQRQLGFSQAGFNVVNGALALIAIKNIKNIQKIESAEKLNGEIRKYATIFGINALIDIGYISGGILLQRYAQNIQFRAIGRTLVYQGSFLLVFDSGMFYKLKQLK